MALDSQLVFQLRVLHDVQFTGSSYRCRQGSSSSAMPRALPMYRLKRSERIRRKAPNTPTLGKRAVDKSAQLLYLCLYGRFSQPSRMCMVCRFKAAVASKTSEPGGREHRIMELHALSPVG